MKKLSLPKADSIEELAAYWDTHDLTDHEDELEEVANPFEKQTVVHVPLNAEQAAGAQRIADSQGITLPALIQYGSASTWDNSHPAGTSRWAR